LITLQKIILLSLSDFRQILREQLLWVMFIVAPTLQFLTALWLIPYLIGQFPVLDGYQSLMVSALSLQVVTGIGFVIAMMLLDEKDDDVLTAIRVLPLGARYFLTYRLLAATFIAFIFCFVMLYYSRLISISLGQALGGAGLFSLLSPMVTLFMSTFGDNKVEGLAMFKGINLVLLIPIVSFFLPPGWHYLLGFIPDFWSFHFVESAATANSASWLNFIIGCLLHLLFIACLYFQFRKRVFK